MSSTQKVIKYGAMGFAIALMVTILSGITAIISGIDKGVHWDGDIKYIDNTEEFDHVESLDLTNYNGEMFIQIGSVDKVIVKEKSVPDTTVVKMKNDNTLCIYDDAKDDWFFNLHFWNDKQDNAQITIILPTDFVAKKAWIDNNSGEMEIRGLYANDLELRGGSGDMTSFNLKADKFDINAGSGELKLDKSQLSDGEIDGGSGTIQITDSSIHNVDINAGSGEIRFDGSMTGDNQLDGGSGEVTLNISESFESYEFDLDEDSGDICINGKEISKNHIKNSNAEHSLEVDGGSGDINLNFSE